MDLASELVIASRFLADELRPLNFSAPVTHTYRTLDYASEGNEQYIRVFANCPKRVLFLGMNPGPFGMAQTGVPFGEVAAVTQWMGLRPEIGKVSNEHPKRPILGIKCTKSEVSGRRLWGLFSQKFPNAYDFFEEHFVINFCPLIWMKESGANLTPNKIRIEEMEPVNRACQANLQKVICLLQPTYLIGVGAYAEAQLEIAKKSLGTDMKTGRILHPSPASPIANRGWAEVAERQLKDLGVW